MLRLHAKQTFFLSTFSFLQPVLSELVVSKIAALLQQKFSLVFVGGTADVMHYLCVFSSFSYHNSDRPFLRMQAFSSFEDDSTLRREYHISFIKYVLLVF